jgi:hypothetical protein
MGIAAQQFDESRFGQITRSGAAEKLVSPAHLPVFNTRFTKLPAPLSKKLLQAYSNVHFMGAVSKVSIGVQFELSRRDEEMWARGEEYKETHALVAKYIYHPDDWDSKSTEEDYANRYRGDPKFIYGLFADALAPRVMDMVDQKEIGWHWVERERTPQEIQNLKNNALWRFVNPQADDDAKDMMVVIPIFTKIWTGHAQYVAGELVGHYLVLILDRTEHQDGKRYAYVWDPNRTMTLREDERFHETKDVIEIRDILRMYPQLGPGGLNMELRIIKHAVQFDPYLCGYWILWLVEHLRTTLTLAEILHAGYQHDFQPNIIYGPNQDMRGPLEARYRDTEPELATFPFGFDPFVNPDMKAVLYNKYTVNGQPVMDVETKVKRQVDNTRMMFNRIQAKFKVIDGFDFDAIRAEEGRAYAAAVLALASGSASASGALTAVALGLSPAARLGPGILPPFPGASAGVQGRKKDVSDRTKYLRAWRRGFEAKQAKPPTRGDFDFSFQNIVPDDRIRQAEWIYIGGWNGKDDDTAEPRYPAVAIIPAVPKGSGGNYGSAYMLLDTTWSDQGPYIWRPSDVYKH